MRQQRLKQFIRSAGVGVIATIADVALLAGLVEFCRLSPEGANVPALAGGLAVQFFGNKYFAFGDRSRNFLRQGTLFALVEAGALTLNAASFHAVVSMTDVPYAFARLACSGVVYLVYSFPLWRLVFKPTVKRPTGVTSCGT